MSRGTLLAVTIGAAVGALGVGRVAFAPLDGVAGTLSLPAVRACVCAPDRDVSFERGDGLRLAGSLYGPEPGASRAAFLLLHGRGARGRALPFYRVLATQLAARGYTVLAADLAGFGDSEDPFQLGDPRAVSNLPDVDAALEFLSRQAGVDARNIWLIGHSMGGGIALQVGLAHPRVQGVVAITPGRRVGERLAGEPGFRTALWSKFRTMHREVYGRDVPDWYAEEDFLDGVRSRNVTRHLAALGSPGHKPVLLVDGGREPPEDRAFLLEYVAATVPPIEHLTLPGADHFANTRGLGTFQLYDARVMERLAEEIDAFAREGPSPSPDA